MEEMERYQKIAYVNLKHNLMLPFFLVLLLCLLSPLAIGLENLNENQTAKVVELFISLFGIILLMSIFTPDIDRDIRDIISSKKESMIVNHVLRGMSALLLIAVTGVLYLAWMAMGGCEFSFSGMFFVLMANCIFLGGLGAFFFSLSNQPVLGYMVPILYYVLNIGSGRKYLGDFYLFSVMQSGSYKEKYILLAGGIGLLVLSVIWRDVLWKKFR
jgi:hypothetical protein